MATAAMPYQHLGEALATNFFFMREQFTDEQWDMFIRTRRFVDREVLPVINDYWEKAEFPWPLARRLAELGIVGDDIEGYGCPGMSPIASGLVHMELHRGDGSLATFLGVQSGLAMKTIAMLGSAEQKERWLPPMARLGKLGALAPADSKHGSDPLALAVAAYDAALTYTKQREQFGRPLCSFQIVQDRLVKMLAEVTGMQLYCAQIARLTVAGKLSGAMAGLAKLNNTRKARQVIAE